MNCPLVLLGFLLLCLLSLHNPLIVLLLHLRLVSLLLSLALCNSIGSALHLDHTVDEAFAVVLDSLILCKAGVRRMYRVGSKSIIVQGWRDRACTQINGKRVQGLGY